MYREFNIVNSFTLEASFMGTSRGSQAGLHFNTNSMQMIGHTFCETLAELTLNEPKVQKVTEQIFLKFGGVTPNIAASEPSNV
jgi:hypothetical protein